MLYESAIRLQQTDFIETEAKTAIQQLEETLLFFEEHAAHEDWFILPHIRQHHAQLVNELENEHRIGNKLSEELTDLIGNWKVAREPEKRDVIGKRMLMVFQEFIAFNLYHMNKEESTFLVVLWQHHSDAEIMQIEQNMIRAVKPDLLTLKNRWMMRSINNQEAVEWLSGIKQNAPDAVFQYFLHLVDEEIPVHRKSVIRKTVLTCATTL